MHRAVKPGIALGLALASWTAQAVDVDRIEIRSRRGEPLLAHIPITGADADDLRALQAQLGSPATFARAGLPRPHGLVADLRFDVVPGAQPLVRVTSTRPVDEDFVTFLLQVDAPDGRLVREYSIALGAGATLPGAPPQGIQVPLQAAPAIVQRTPDPADALPPSAGPPSPQEEAPPALVADVPPVPLHVDRATPARIESPAPTSERPAPAAPAPGHARVWGGARSARDGARAEVPSPVASRASAARTDPAPAPTEVAPAARRPGDYVVRDGDTLAGALKRMPLPASTPAQAMLAVLRANPDAFAGNINRLLRGAVLRVPTPEAVSRIAPAAAETAVRLQMAQWRSGTIPTPAVAAALQTPAIHSIPSMPPVDATPPALPPPIPVIPRVSAPRLQLASADPGGASGGSHGATARGSAAGGAIDRERAAADALAVRFTQFQQAQQRVVELEQRHALLLARHAELSARPRRGRDTLAWSIAALAVLVAAGALLWRRHLPSRPTAATRALVDRLARSRNATA